MNAEKHATRAIVTALFRTDFTHLARPSPQPRQLQTFANKGRR